MELSVPLLVSPSWPPSPALGRPRIPVCHPHYLHHWEKFVSDRIECLHHHTNDMIVLNMSSLIPQTSQWPQKGSAS